MSRIETLFVQAMTQKGRPRRSSFELHMELNHPLSHLIHSLSNDEITHKERFFLNEQSNIYSRAFDNGPRDFESWSSDEDDTELLPLSWLQQPNNGRMFELRLQQYVALPPYTAYLQRFKARTHDVPTTSP
ncbi:hypothetical protein TNCV_1721081 [Trichonephila clavipes]|nr:hypothetical protein TNCV_1721081 [Trichonephila clavipes]